ncbi:helix-turn-helix transcriptional regulator [Niabella sp.]|uniref:helix-turn-helix domain-containing protein n=1 Tax=Niabella sp. TaxID=1962976 RepID=UPI00260F854C|nr:helix-turn-helix transcriptional regulator [Niabella sp.]
METNNSTLPLTTAEQAKLLGISKNAVRWYENGLRAAPGAQLERLDQLYQAWNTLCKSKQPLFPLIDTLHAKMQARHWLLQQQTQARQKGRLLQARLERMRCFFRPVPDKLILVQHLLKAGDTTVYDHARLKKMEIRLLRLTDLYGPVQQELVKHQIALAAYTEQLVTETLHRLLPDGWN